MQLTSRLHELHESKFPFVSRIEFIRSKLSNFSAHVQSGSLFDSPFCGSADASVSPGCVFQAGANMIVSGSAVVKSPQPADVISQLKQAVQKVFPE